MRTLGSDKAVATVLPAPAAEVGACRPAIYSEACLGRVVQSNGPCRTASDLDSLHLTVRHQRRTVPTVGGVLLFGRDRLAHFPDAWVQAGRFAGVDRSRILDQTEILSHPSEAVPVAVAFVEKHGLHGAHIGAVRRTSIRSLPPVAVREALVNALMHADYAQRGAPIRVALFDDRLEVENPGLLPFEPDARRPAAAGCRSCATECSGVSSRSSDSSSSGAAACSG